jgi:RNA polymerase sigma-70 factor (ECF subfamily)
MHADNADLQGVRPRIVAFLPRLRRFCAVLARNEDRGDDLMQATVEKALARIDQWQPGSSLESWMFRIAQNIHIDEARTQARRGTSVDIDEAMSLAGEDGRAVLEGRSDLDKARQAMAALPEEQRALMALVVLDGRSYKEAAEILDIPIGTVMSRISRARQSIDRALHGEGQFNG